MTSKYFIIAGTNKAATTSFFEYLADHPEISPAYIKQTFFFLDKQWQQHWGMKSILDYDNGVDQYESFFRNAQPNQHKLEATPDYLYSPGTAQRLKYFLDQKQGKILFILRDPVKRFISLYHFGKQQGILPADMDFTSFRKASEVYAEFGNPSLLAYRTGFYSTFLEEYFQHFDRSQILIYFFEDLKKDSLALMKRAAVDLGVEPSFYEQYSFGSHNTTVQVRSKNMEKMYGAIRTGLMYSVYKYPIPYKIIMGIKKRITPLYKKMNSAPLEKDLVPDAEIAYLEKIYAEEGERLAALTKLDVPWCENTASI